MGTKTMKDELHLIVTWLSKLGKVNRVARYRPNDERLWNLPTEMGNLEVGDKITVEKIK